MKAVLIIIAFFLMSKISILLGQNIYYDAIELSKMKITVGSSGQIILPKSNIRVYQILNNYISNDNLGKIDSIGCNRIDDYYNENSKGDNNPFIEIGGSAHESSYFVPQLGNALSSFGGLDVTNFADGFAKFIVKRTKQELSIAFFEKFKDELNNPKYYELKILFPTTTRTLNAIDKELYNYSAYLVTIKQSFEKDLSQLDTHFPDLWEQEKFRELFKENPELEVIIKTSFMLNTSLINGKHPGEILNQLSKDTYTWNNKDIMNFKSSLKLLDLFSQSIRSEDQNKYWISSDSVRMLMNDTTLLNIYLGLIYQKLSLNDIIFIGSGKDTCSLKNVLYSISNNMEKCADYIEFAYTLARKVEYVDQSYIVIKSKSIGLNDTTSSRYYYQFFNSSLDVFDQMLSIDDLPGMNFTTPDYFKTFVYTNRLVNDAYLDIAFKNYFSAIINISAVADTIYNSLNIDIRVNEIKTEINKLLISFKEDKEIDDTIKVKVNECVKSILKGEQTKLKDISGILSTYPKYSNMADSLSFYYIYKFRLPKDTYSKLIKYGTLAANIANAKTSDEVEAAIESIALPAGSSIVKRESRKNISLNAYCGLYMGHDSEKFGSFKESPKINTYGITAPIGVCYSWGGRKMFGKPSNKDGHFSHSVLLSVIDIGAIAAFRFADDTTQTLSKIQLKDIISPGLYYSVGIPKSPVSINLGYQISPILSKVTANENTFKNSCSRFCISVCIDIPLLNLYTVSK